MRDAASSFDISDCATQQDMALWLLRCPLSGLILDEAFIRRWLRLSGFGEGLFYLESMLSILREDRRDDGHIASHMSFCCINGRLRRIAEGREPVGLGD